MKADRDECHAKKHAATANNNTCPASDSIGNVGSQRCGEEAAKTENRDQETEDRSGRIIVGCMDKLASLNHGSDIHRTRCSSPGRRISLSIHVSMASKPFINEPSYPMHGGFTLLVTPLRKASKRQMSLPLVADVMRAAHSVKYTERMPFIFHHLILGQSRPPSSNVSFPIFNLTGQYG